MSQTLSNCEIITQSYLDSICQSKEPHHHGYEIDTVKHVIIVLCGLMASWRIDLDHNACGKCIPFDDLCVLREYVARWNVFASITVNRCTVGCGPTVCHATRRFCNCPILACRSVLVQENCAPHLRVLDAEIQDFGCGTNGFTISLSLRTRTVSSQTDKSIGERCIQAYLQSQGLVEIDRVSVNSPWQPHDNAFSTQQTFFELRNVLPLRLDFWVLPFVKPWEFCTGVAIECDFDPSHRLEPNTDVVKTAFFFQRSIPLVRIPPEHEKDPVAFLETALLRLRITQKAAPVSRTSEIIEYDPLVKSGLLLCASCGRPSDKPFCTNYVCQNKQAADRQRKKYHSEKHEKLHAATIGLSVQRFRKTTNRQGKKTQRDTKQKKPRRPAKCGKNAPTHPIYSIVPCPKCGGRMEKFKQQCALCVALGVRARDREKKAKQRAQRQESNENVV